MTGWYINWLAFVLVVLLPAGTVFVMAAILIRERIRAKRRC